MVETAAAPVALEVARRFPRRIGTRQMTSSHCFRIDGGADRCCMALSTFQVTGRKADGPGQTKKEVHEQPRIDRPCRLVRRMTQMSSARKPVDEEADGEMGGGDESESRRAIGLDH